MANGTDVPSAGQHPTSIAEHHSFFKLGAFIAERWARLLHSTGIAVTGLVDAIKCIDYGCCIEEEQRMTLTAQVFILPYILLHYFNRYFLALSAVYREFLQVHQPPLALLGSEGAVELWVKGRDGFQSERGGAPLGTGGLSALPGVVGCAIEADFAFTRTTAAHHVDLDLEADHAFVLLQRRQVEYELFGVY